MVVIVKCRLGHLFARMSHSIPRAALAPGFTDYCTVQPAIVPMGRWPRQTQTYCLLLRAAPLPILKMSIKSKCIIEFKIRILELRVGIPVLVAL